uniref:Inositol-tetrakisphosphate 1-kinase N-terminal domain-containing protein n=1 Tax=Plectus sambesii TaxID=2011161 RepID=A0A914V0B2_9BILA
MDWTKNTMDLQKTIVVGYWMSQKKLKKLCINEFVKYCALHDIQLVELDLDKEIGLQGPFHAILHKFSDVWTAAEVDDSETAKKRWANVQ